MYYLRAQGVDEGAINIHYYYYYRDRIAQWVERRTEKPGEILTRAHSEHRFPMPSSKLCQI